MTALYIQFPNLAHHFVRLLVGLDDDEASDWLSTSF